ncbi:MAG: RNA polymerase sporulation sigma factor SigE [Clostridia bacterium]|nr:RNA polymerase sporulation sigma factor SigE [Clostridia bacterium]
MELIKKIYRLWLGVIEKLCCGRGKNDINYINGPETLPPPLSLDEEIRLLGLIETDESVRSIFIEHNLRLVVYIAKKFENTGVGLEDLISIGTIGLIKAINTFKSDKNIKLATYASRCIENEILMYIRKSSNSRCEMSFDDPLSIDWDGNELLLSDILGSDEDLVYADLETDEDRKTIHAALGKLPERDRRIIEMRYGIGEKKELTQKEVADALGISQSYISRLEKRIIDELREEIGNKI